MFCAIALGALLRPLGVVSFSVWAPRVLQWSLKKRQKVFKNNGLGRFGGILLGRPTWTIRTKNAFPCSVRLVFHFCKAFPCSVALIFFDEIAFPCRRRSIFIRSAPSGGSGPVCLDRSVWIRSVWVRSVWNQSVWMLSVCLDAVCLDAICLDAGCLDTVCLHPVCLDSGCLTLVYLDELAVTVL